MDGHLDGQTDKPGCRNKGRGLKSSWRMEPVHKKFIEKYPCHLDSMVDAICKRLYQSLSSICLHESSPCFSIQTR